MKQYLQIGTLLALMLAGLFLLFLALQKLAALVVLILIAVVITTGIDPLVKRLQQLSWRNRRIPRAVATIFVLLLGIMLFLGALSFLVATAVGQAINFAQNEALQTALYRWAGGLSTRYPFIPNLDTILDRVRAQSGQIAGYLWTTTVAIFGILGSVFSAFTVFILSFFFTTFKEGITYTLTQLVPPRYQGRTREVGHQAAQKMGGWLRGQITLALIVTVTIAAFMSIVGFAQYAVLVGIIGGIGELIPMVGPYVAFFPALAIVLLLDGATWQIVAIIVFFMVLSQVENYYLAPKIMERQVGLHPVTTILALLTGGSLLGLIGALLAIPLAAAGRVVMLDVVFPAIQRKSRQEIEQSQPEARAKAGRPARRKKQSKKQ